MGESSVGANTRVHLGRVTEYDMAGAYASWGHEGRRVDDEVSCGDRARPVQHDEEVHHKDWPDDLDFSHSLRDQGGRQILVLHLPDCPSGDYKRTIGTPRTCHPRDAESHKLFMETSTRWSGSSRRSSDFVYT